MPLSPITNLSRLCLHTITTKPWSLEQAVAEYQAAGINAITVWRYALEQQPLSDAARLLRESGMTVVSLCRGGFFVAPTAAKRTAAIDDHPRAPAEAHPTGAPHIVMVCGADPKVPLADARQMIFDGISAILPDAQSAGVKLAIEPLHPMYADIRSAINTLKQANDLVDRFASPSVGVAVDVYHLWWDESLEAEIRRAGKSILAFHVCDWLVPTHDLLYDRGVMGEGIIDIRQIRRWVEEAGFAGPIEVEIFSTTLWETDPHEALARLKEAYLHFV